MSTLQWRKNPETTKSRRNLKGCQHSGNIFEAFSTDGEIVVNLKNRLISEQNMNPLLQQKCVFCRDERLPKHKKRQTKPDLLISSVFFKASPTYEQLKKKNHLQDSTNSWTKPESLTTAKKFLFKEKKLPNTKQHTKPDFFLQLFSKTFVKPVSPNENVAS